MLKRFTFVVSVNYCELLERFWDLSYVSIILAFIGERFKVFFYFLENLTKHIIPHKSVLSH